MPRSIRLLDGGLSNHVASARVGRETYVVRMSEEPSRLSSFLKEQWAVKKAGEHGVPVPEILEVSNEVDGLSHMVARLVTGRCALEAPDRPAILRQLGEHARTINSIRTSHFGHVFNWSRNRLSRNNSWREYLDRELKVAERLKFFRTERLLTSQNLKRLEKLILRLKQLPAKPALNHGDLRLKNVLIDDKNKIKAIIDWEHCTSHAAPHWELAIALHDLGIDEKEAFLSGYGLNPATLEASGPLMTAINILNYAPALRDGQVPPEGKAFLRARLNGWLDLYSL